MAVQGRQRMSVERYIPDVGFISYARQPELSYKDGYIPLAPALAVEALSPGNDRSAMMIKVNNYRLDGTVVWLADPLPREVVVFVPGKLARTLSLEDTLEGGDARRASRWR